MQFTNRFGGDSTFYLATPSFVQTSVAGGKRPARERLPSTSRRLVRELGAASCRRGVDLKNEGGIGVLQLLLGDGAPEALVLVVALFVFKLDIDIVVFDRVLPVPGFAVGVGGVDKALVVENKPT